MNLLNPSFCLWPDQVRPTLRNFVEAKVHHIIRRRRIGATGEPAGGRFLKDLFNLQVG